MNGQEFEFDLAFSFHSKDEPLAQQLSDRLSDRMKVFIYSEQQKILAGRDGEETFNSVYGGRARVVAVVYRKEWGETPFTRIEQTAIRTELLMKVSTSRFSFPRTVEVLPFGSRRPDCMSVSIAGV